MLADNRVKFVYITSSGELPSYPDYNTIYFVEAKKEIRVGSRLLANVDESAVDMDTLSSILESYDVKSVEISGSGNTVSDVSFNNSSGRLSFIKSNLPVLSKAAASQQNVIDLNDETQFVSVTDISVSDHTITQESTKYILPAKITSIVISNNQDDSLKFELIYSDGSRLSTNYAGFGSAAFADVSDFMLAEGGVANNARITLYGSPVDNYDAATKKYVDNVTDSLGAAIKLRRINTAYKLVGGGDLESDRTISHDTIFPADVLDTDVSETRVVSNISYDRAGHILEVIKTDISNVSEAELSHVTIYHNNWQHYDPISYRYPAVFTVESHNYYDIHLNHNVGSTIGKMCADADIRVRIENRQINLYCYGTLPTDDFELEITIIPISTDEVGLSYDIGDDFLVHSNVTDNLDDRLTALEAVINNLILISKDVNVPSSSWVSSSNVDYPYAADISIDGLTADHMPVVQFLDSDANLYNFSYTAVSDTNKLTIFCKNRPMVQITIPTIICFKSSN